MAIGACIRGFHSVMRPVIAIGRTFLKGKYGGVMFIASCKDGNEQFYPLAFGIGDSENDASWEWFLRKFHGVIGEVKDLVFISYCNRSIEMAIHNVFPSAHPGACTYHIS